jgi:ribosome-associated toxin RatA of RatAB toxin-antitoxin module
MAEVRLVRNRWWRLPASVYRLVLALLVFAFGTATEAAGVSPVRSIEVREAGQAFVVDLVMWAPVRRELAFDVLLDFEHIPDWSPNVRESRVINRDGHSATVEYSGHVHLGFLSIPYTTVREVEFASPRTIDTTQVKGTLRRHVSRSVLTPEGAGTRLEYHLEMEPSAMAAPLVNKVRIERELRDTFEAAAGEMVRRKAVAAPSLR